jgi:hypothetical protein
LSDGSLLVDVLWSVRVKQIFFNFLIKQADDAKAAKLKAEANL